MSHHEHLPLEGYDQMSVEMLRHAIRPLTEQDLNELLEYERTHADRPLVKEILTGRLTALEEGAEPSPGEPPSAPPEADQPRDRERVHGDTQADRSVQPSHGVPINKNKPRLGPHN